MHGSLLQWQGLVVMTHASSWAGKTNRNLFIASFERASIHDSSHCRTEAILSGGVRREDVL